jgi:glycosyltransferase involved in cell wall biosynthesis
MSRSRRPRSRFDIAFYVPWAGPLLARGATTATGGAETQIFLLARALARRGSNVSLLVFDLPGAAIPSSVDGVAVSVRPPYRAHERLGKLRETLALRRAVVDADADVIVTRSAGPDVGLAGLFAKLSGRRYVFSSANVSDFDYGRLSPKRRDQILLHLGMRLADEVVVQTTEQVRMCEERFGRSPVLIKSIAEPAPQRDRDPDAFLWVGRLVWYKRPLAFIELARALPQARFRMVGVPVPYAQGGRELVAAVECEAATVPNLELLTQRPRRELMDLVERAVAVVNTSDFEGMPNVFLEGWARGVPSLALTHDPDNVIKDYELGGFAHGRHEQLVDLARRLWEERADQSAVAARCRHYIAEHHSPEVIAARWQEALGVAAPTVTTKAALAS